MNPRICVCCGEPINVKGNTPSRNPNICASCLNLADGMNDTNVPGLPECGETAADFSLLVEPKELAGLGRGKAGSANAHN